MRLDVGCELIYTVETPTPMLLMLRPRSGVGQWVAQERYEFEPLIPAMEYTDSYGNLCQRIVAPVGQMRIQTHAQVEVADTADTAPGAGFTPVAELPDDTLQFLLPSRYCPSDDPQLGELVQRIVQDVAPGYDQVAAICTWIHTKLEYRYGVSSVTTSALQTIEYGAGVCRDFAHVGITLSRTLSIPARMVVGYLYQLEPMDLHAWFEAYVDGRWYMFDATQAVPRGGRVSVAYGRDAADVALSTQFGQAQLDHLRVWVAQAESQA
ncbi:MAG: transglutaminase family protein [Chloroflexaceae bacterium]|nr:transglutaminase family protein [Chloroflexaceae bacterium]